MIHPNKSTPSRSEPILVLDDEEVIVSGLTATLTQEGFQVDGFTDPFTALRYAKLRTYAVMLSDQKMPGLTGLQFFEEARKLRPNASRILITGVLNLDTVIESINKGEIYRFMVKPWYREELLATIQNAMQRYELLCRNDALQARTLAMNRELQAQVAHIGEQNENLVKLNDVLRENLQRSIELCLHMIEAYLPALGSQAHRVHHICRAMAEVLQLDPEQAKVLGVAAWLHDIGLIAVPRDLVRQWRANPKDLSPAELSLIQQHPSLGETLAGFAQPLEAVASAIRSHHERFDGTGYPDRLRGDEIPWLARLLGVAVGYASSNLDASGAEAAVKLEAGRAFDPEAVRVLIRALPRSSIPRNEKEVLLSELRPGMRLAKGIYTANGVLLLPQGQYLTQTCIDKVLNHNRMSAINQSLAVYC